MTFLTFVNLLFTLSINDLSCLHTLYAYLIMDFVITGNGSILYRAVIYGVAIPFVDLRPLVTQGSTDSYFESNVLPEHVSWYTSTTPVTLVFLPHETRKLYTSNACREVV